MEETKPQINGVANVLEFHTTFGHPIGKLSEPTEGKELAFRVAMVFEENAELAEAADKKATLVACAFHYVNTLAGFPITKEECDARIALYCKQHNIVNGTNENKIEILDAAKDIEYFVNGLLVSTGLYKVSDAASELVHSNNMTKAHKSREHAEATIEYLNAQEGTPSFTYGIVETTDPNKFLLKRSDSKLIKPWDHVKVKLDTLFK